MRRRSRTAFVALAVVILAGALVFFLVGSSTPMCQTEADRVAVAMANPLGPTPSLAGLTTKDANTVRIFRSTFIKAYNGVSGPNKAAIQNRAIVRWNTFIIPQMKISTRQEFGCK